MNHPAKPTFDELVLAALGDAADANGFIPIKLGNPTMLRQREIAALLGRQGLALTEVEAEAAIQRLFRDGVISMGLDGLRVLHAPRFSRGPRKLPTTAYGAILRSELWGQPEHVRRVWLAALVMCNADGVVQPHEGVTPLQSLAWAAADEGADPLDAALVEQAVEWLVARELVVRDGERLRIESFVKYQIHARRRAAPNDEETPNGST